MEEEVSGGDAVMRNHCARLWVTFFSLESLPFSFARWKDVLMLFLMASNLLIFLPSTSC